jgi:hypothetical protein
MRNGQGIYRPGSRASGYPVIADGRQPLDWIQRLENHVPATDSSARKLLPKLFEVALGPKLDRLRGWR